VRHRTHRPNLLVLDGGQPAQLQLFVRKVLALLRIQGTQPLPLLSRQLVLMRRGQMTRRY